MASPRFLIVACALLLVQAQAHPQAPVKGILMDIIKYIVPKTENALDKIIDISSEIVNEAASDPVAYQVKTAEKLDEALDKAFDWINSKLDIIKGKGSASTGKVVDCLKGNKVPIKKVITGFYSRTTACMAPEVQDLLQKLSNIQPDIQVIKTEAFAAANKIQGCSGTYEEEAECLAQVVEGILDVWRGASSDTIQKALDIVLTIVNKLEAHVPKCVVPNFELAKKETIEQIDATTACVVA